MSVGSIIGGGFRLIRTQPQIVAIWGILYLIVMTASTLAMRPFVAQMAQLQQQPAANAAPGLATLPHFPGAAVGTLFGIQLAFAVLSAVAFAAVVRAVVRPTGDRFAYLRLGMDELRLIGLGVILVVLGILAEIVVIILMMIVGFGSGFILGKIGAGVVVGICAIAGLGAAIYAEVRISLAGAFTVMTGRIVIKDAWRATKGQFWTLFGAYLLLSLVYLVISLVILAVVSRDLLTAYISLDMPAIQAATQAKYAGQSLFSVSFISQLIGGAIIAVPMGVIFLGSVATAAFELSGEKPTVAAQFE